MNDAVAIEQNDVSKGQYTERVMKLVDIMRGLVDKGKRTGVTIADWSPLAELVAVDEFERVHPSADEDLARDDGEKTSAVHFLRFEIPQPVRLAIKAGSDIRIGVRHPQFTMPAIRVDPKVRDSLADDLD